MRTVSYLTGTAPAPLLVVQGLGRALNPTSRSGRPQDTNLSAFGYDSEFATHRNGIKVNSHRTDAFDTPVGVYIKNSGWMTVKGGKDSLTITYSPDAVVKFAEVYNEETGELDIVCNITLREYMETYC